MPPVSTAPSDPPPNTPTNSTESQQLINSLKSKITDQEEQIRTLIKKRRDDLEKIKESDHMKIQLDQVCHRKNVWFFCLEK